MRRFILPLIATILVSLSGCAVYVPPPPRAYVAVPAPVIVAPGWGYSHWHRW
jgi:hypothetical protein